LMNLLGLWLTLIMECTIQRKILYQRAFTFIEVKSRLRIPEMQSEE